MKQIFICQRCHRKHVIENPIVDTFITCGCGYSFYCFGNGGMNITIPKHELTENVCRNMMSFIQSTGRCPDAPAPPPEKDDFMEKLQRMDAYGLLEIAMKKMQNEVFGAELMHWDDIESILELLYDNKDALVKKQKGYVNIVEQRNRNHRKSECDYLRLVEDTMAAVGEKPGICREETPLKQWQIDIMEENAARMGFLFGESG